MCTCFNLLSVVFVHGLRGHPQRTWEYTRASPVATTKPEQTGLSKRRRMLSRLGFKAKAQDPQTPSVTQPSESKLPTEVFWPAEQACARLPRARIWTYGYNADVIGGLFEANNQNSIHKHGNDFMVKIERTFKDSVSDASLIRSCFQP